MIVFIKDIEDNFTAVECTAVGIVEKKVSLALFSGGILVTDSQKLKREYADILRSSAGEIVDFTDYKFYPLQMLYPEDKKK